MRLIDADKVAQELHDYYHGSYSEVQLSPYQVYRWLEKQPTVMRWISTKEQMPEDNITVLVTVSLIDDHTFVTEAWRDNGVWECYATDDSLADADVIAWMELPGPASAQKGEE